jgi:hypothetical protein
VVRKGGRGSYDSAAPLSCPRAVRRGGGPSQSAGSRPRRGRWSVASIPPVRSAPPVASTASSAKVTSSKAGPRFVRAGQIRRSTGHCRDAGRSDGAARPRGAVPRPAGRGEEGPWNCPRADRESDPGPQTSPHAPGPAGRARHSKAACATWTSALTVPSASHERKPLLYAVMRTRPTTCAPEEGYIPHLPAHPDTTYAFHLEHAPVVPTPARRALLHTPSAPWSGARWP